MNLDDAAAWARTHKALAAGAGAAALLALLYLHHRAKTNTTTAGTTGATVNGAGDYLVPYSNTSDPTGMSTDNGAGTLANAITGLTTTLGGLTIPRSTDPTAVAAKPKTTVKATAKAGLSPHAEHLAAIAHAQHLARTAPHLLTNHQKHLLHLEYLKSKGLAAPAPKAPKTPTGAHSGQTAKPGGATSTGPAPATPPTPPVPTRRSSPLRRNYPIPLPPPPQVPTHQPIVSRPY
jgi:hypothetical protein